MTDPVTEAVTTSIWSHLLTVGGFLLAVFAIARLISEKRQPGNTLAWLLGIVLVPYLGVPLFLMLGGRKIKQLAETKLRVALRLPGAPRPAEETASLPAVRTIVANGGGEPVGGNTLKLLTDGQTAYVELIRCIREAEHSIHIATFILGRDEVGMEIVRLLAERARAGVRVRLLLDAFGCFMTSRGFVEPLRAAGGEVAKFMPVAMLSTRHSANLRNHRKIAVFDHCTAIVGGHNIARDYMGPKAWAKRFDDFGAVITGPAAALLNEVFLADWAFASGDRVENLNAEFPRECPLAVGHGDLQVITSGPDVEGDPLYEGLVSMIQEAERSIWIITPYFIPDEVLQRSLLVKARAGKDVTIIVPRHSNHAITDYARRQYLRELHAAGARIMHYTPRMLHAKAMIIDDKYAVFGSANFDLRSLFVNFEIGIASYTPAETAPIRQWAGQLLENCEEHDPRQQRRNRVLGNIAEEIGRLLAPLL